MSSHMMVGGHATELWSVFNFEYESEGQINDMFYSSQIYKIYLGISFKNKTNKNLE